jgi:hypothetical protein
MRIFIFTLIGLLLSINVCFSLSEPEIITNRFKLGNSDIIDNIGGPNGLSVLDAEGKVPAGAETDPIVGAITGIPKADGDGNISAAVAGTDYLVTEVDPTVAGAITDHEVAADPHTGYMLESNIGVAANNYVQLDGLGKLPTIDGANLQNVPSTFYIEERDSDPISPTVGQMWVLSNIPPTSPIVSLDTDAWGITSVTIAMDTVSTDESVAPTYNIVLSDDAWTTETNIVSGLTAANFPYTISTGLNEGTNYGLKVVASDGSLAADSNTLSWLTGKTLGATTELLADTTFTGDSAWVAEWATASISEYDAVSGNWHINRAVGENPFVRQSINTVTTSTDYGMTITFTIPDTATSWVVSPVIYNGTTSDYVRFVLNESSLHTSDYTLTKTHTGSTYEYTMSGILNTGALVGGGAVLVRFQPGLASESQDIYVSQYSLKETPSW